MFLVYLFIFFLGLSVGSFINVLVLRWGTGLGLSGRSLCFSCGRELQWYELVPLISFLVQSGRCRSCRAKISWQYPITEFLCGALFMSIFWKLNLLNVLGEEFFGVWPLVFRAGLFTYYAAVFSLLLAIAVYDVRHKIIPNQFVYSFAALSLLGVFGFESLGLFGNWKFEIGNLIAAPLLALPFAFFWFISGGRWMGLGDAKLAWGIGWFLGLSQGLSALILSFWAGAFFGLVLIGAGKFFHLLLGSKRYTMKSEISFAPFLIIGVILAFFFNIEPSMLLRAFIVSG